MPRSLAPDATIADVFGRVALANNRAVTHALHYLDIVQRKLKQLGSEEGELVVRIGITGGGEYPSFRVEHASEPGRPIQAFDADGKPWMDPDGQPWTGHYHPGNWSTRCITYAEIRELDCQLRMRISRVFT